MPNEITIVVKDSGADRTIADLRALQQAARGLSGTRAEVKADADTGRASAELEELRRLVDEVGGRTARVHAELDDTRARFGLDEIKHKADALDGKRVNILVDISTSGLGGLGGALGSLGGLFSGGGSPAGIAGMVLGGGMLAAGGGALAGVSLGGLAAGGGALGAGLLGFSGIGDAVKQLGVPAATGGGGGGGDPGKAARDNLALASALDAVKTATRELANAQLDAKSAAISSGEAIAAAEHNVTDAQRQETQAQQDLLHAREDAAAQLRQLSDETADMALRQRDAALRVKETKDALDAAMKDRHGTQETRDRAQLTYDEALQSQKELGEAADDLAKKKADADKKGINGADEVVAAQQRLAQATRGVADAQRAVMDAQRAAADQQRHSAAQVAAAQQAVVSAHRGVQQAELQAASAAGGSAAAQQKLATAMDNLSPAGQRFAKFMRGFIDGPIKELRFAAQDGLLPPIQGALKAMTPDIEKMAPGIKTLSGEFGKFIAAGIQIAVKVAPAFLQLATVGMKALEPLIPVFENVGLRIAGIIQGLIKSGEINKWMGMFDDIMTQLIQHLPDILLLIADLTDEIGPELAPLVAALIPLFIQFIELSGPMLVGAIKLAIPIIKFLTRVFELTGPAIQDVQSEIHDFITWLGHFKGAVHTAGDTLHRWKLDVESWIRELVHWVEGLDPFGPISRSASDMYDSVTGFFDRLGTKVSDFSDSVGGALSGAFSGIPGLATGGIVGGAATGGAHGGWRMVGEHGRELLRLPAGTSVHSNSDTERMLSGGGGHGGGDPLRLQVDDTDLGRFLAELIRKFVRTKGGNVQVVLGRS